MPRRFDQAIKVLVNEKHRVIGKVAENEILQKRSLNFDVLGAYAKKLNEAIEILEKHERNKNV